MRKPALVVSEQFDTNWAVQSQKMVRGLKYVFVYAKSRLSHEFSETDIEGGYRGCC